MKKTQSEMKMVTYYDSKNLIHVGDHVEIKIWFRWRKGQVVYVPGISKLNPNMEYNGLSWIGIQVIEGPFVGVVVDPEEKHIKKTVKFIQRGKAQELASDIDPFIE